jgi:hypothetical protein
MMMLEPVADVFVDGVGASVRLEQNRLPFWLLFCALHGREMHIR